MWTVKYLSRREFDGGGFEPVAACSECYFRDFGTGTQYCKHASVEEQLAVLHVELVRIDVAVANSSDACITSDGAFDFTYGSLNPASAAVNGDDA